MIILLACVLTAASTTATNASSTPANNAAAASITTANHRAPPAAAMPPPVHPLPSLDVLRDAAVRRLNLSPEVFAEWQSRVRKRHLLPSFSVRTVVNSYDTEANAVAGLSVSLRTSYGVEARLEFNFSELYFDSNEIGIMRESVRAARLREELLHELRTAYFELSGVLRQLREPSFGPAGDNKLRQRQEELIATLDDLTGSTFSALWLEKEQP